jgi:hypothetical protein
MRDVKAWAEASGWVTPLPDGGLTLKENRGAVRYDVPVLELTRGEVWVTLVPYARFAREDDGQLEFFPTKAEGRVESRNLPDDDLLAVLHLHEGRWIFEEAAPSDEAGSLRAKMIPVGPVPLDEVSTNRLLDAITPIDFSRPLLPGR